MAPSGVRLSTARVVLRGWHEGDREQFALMNADPDVMADLGGPLTRSESDRKLDRFLDNQHRYGFTRWVVERRRDDGESAFVGYAGGKPVPAEHPLGAHVDIGWRLRREAWGHGYATEAALAALNDLFERVGLTEVFAYTSPQNQRSQAVMARLGLERRPDDDFVVPDEKLGEWLGLVWVAHPTQRAHLN